VVALDLDEDGHTDVLIANHHSHDLTILFGDGLGGFEEGQRVPVPGPNISHPLSVAIDDFNEDGHLDVATVSFLNNQLSVFFGDGDGNFLLGLQMDTHRFALRVVAADFDGDENVDLAWCARDDDSVQVSLGDGEGGFAAPASYLVGDRPVALVTADVDGDGDADLISSDSLDGRVSVLLGDGHGDFPDIDVMDGFGTVSYTAVADLDADGDMDFAIAHDDGISIVLGGDGDGPRQPRGAGHGLGSTPTTLDFADIDENGTLDIIAPSSVDEEVVVLLGDGEGSFTEGARIAVGMGPWGVVAADFDEDGHVDIVVTNELSYDAHFLRNASFDAVHYRRGDANGDGSIDVSDPVETLNYLFLGGARPGCLEALNANGDVSIDLGDAVWELSFLFLAGAPPPPPFESCGLFEGEGVGSCDESTGDC
jgi:hypothetical protein